MKDGIGCFFREYYVYDLANGGRLVFCSASSYKRTQAEGLLESLSAEDRREWEEYLKSYRMIPAIAKTCMGVAVVLPYLMPSASLFMVCIPSIKQSDFCKLALRDPEHPILLGEEMRCASKGRLHDPTGELTERYHAFMKQIERCYGHAEYGARPVPEEIDGILEERIRELSEFLEVPVHISHREKIMNYGEVEEGFFLAYVTMLLTLAKNDLPKGEVSFALEEKSYGCSVSVMLCGWNRIRRVPTDVLWMDYIASKKRILLDVTPLPNGLMIRFSPMSKDWAILGLKQNHAFDWAESISSEKSIN
ncbi:MAG: hypothetical protein IKA76_07255 [Clostridia bacterium]|nr:hypothetical protein [Clostridia bacterium]